jgi:hypothetical protein
MNMTGTGVVIVFVGIVLLCWEILAFVLGKRRALISTWMQKLGFRSPITVFVAGIFAGHFWAYFPPTLDDEHVVCPHCRQEFKLQIDDAGRLSGESNVGK